MSTFTTKAIVDQMIARVIAEQDNGFAGRPYPADDPLVARVTEYDTPEGQTCWGVEFYSVDGYRASEYVCNPRVIFDVEQCRADNSTCPYRAWGNGFCGPHQPNPKAYR